MSSLNQKVNEMRLQKMAGCACVLVGLLACLSGTDSALRADSPCVVSEAISPAICLPAHQEQPRANPLIPDSSGGCVNYYNFWCWPDPEIGCWTEGHGRAVYGECIHHISESAIGFCFNNYNEAEVILLYHRSECEFFDGVCQCLWIIGEQPPIAYYVCDCAVVI